MEALSQIAVRAEVEAGCTKLNTLVAVSGNNSGVDLAHELARGLTPLLERLTQAIPPPRNPNHIPVISDRVPQEKEEQLSDPHLRQSV